MKKIFLILFICLGLQAKPTVSVSIAPQEFLLRSIAGDTLNINTIVGANDDPHSYEPKPKQIAAVGQSDVYFLIGIEFEDIWAKRFAAKYPNVAFVDSTKGIERIKNEHSHDHHDHDAHDHDHDAHHHHDHDHDHHAHHDHDRHAHHDHDHHDHDAHHHHHDHHGHHHGEYDTHVWLDPVHMQTMADNILATLLAKYPSHKDLYTANHAALSAKLAHIHAYNQNALKDLRGKVFMVYHPSWGYYAKRYGLIQLAVEIDGKEPKAKDLEILTRKALEHGTRVIFVSPQFSSKSARLIADKTGAKVYQIDQLSLDYLGQMQKLTDAIATSLKH